MSKEEKKMTMSTWSTHERIEVLSIWDLVMTVAKKLVGMDVDEELKEKIKAQEEMLKNEEQSVALNALLELMEKENGMDKLAKAMKGFGEKAEE